ncbi:hypothetical protein [Eggerthella guodeyinii]|uniref:DUF7695 domain-containing protein n=1 Tax=Eggerthella guodeyinii TaxID=2690837 RepID=A0A6N7RT80_9ACTN|nr:hypothetical protein [Eggerthella guodeyinii]MRX83958.1 hypothetical protein [Eggerthella guodeyinii]
MSDDNWREPQIPAALASRLCAKEAVMLVGDDEEGICVQSWPEGEDLWEMPVADEDAAVRILDEALRPLGYAKLVVLNQLRCGICGEFVESTTRHDFKMCSCGNVGVDGGHDYARRTHRTGRYIDFCVFGWVAGEKRREAVARLEAEGSHLSIQDRVLGMSRMRTYEVSGREGGTGEEVREYAEGRSKYEAAKAVVESRPGMEVSRITDRSLPFDQQILLEKLGNERLEGIVVEELEDWEGQTAELFEVAEAKREVDILRIHIVQKSAKLAEDRKNGLSD